MSPVNGRAGDSTASRAMSEYGSATRPPAGAWVGYELCRVQVNDLISRIRKWDHDIPSKSNTCREPIVDLDIVLNISRKRFVSQPLLVGQDALAGICVSQKKACEGASVTTEIWIVGIWRGCGPLAKTKRTAAKIAGDDVLIRAPELSSKV